MAIRDFGTSLLSNVRERKDSQARDARKYAEKQQKKNLLIAGGAWLGSQLFKVGNANVAQNTQNFLANSELYNNKINMSKAEKTVVEATAHFKKAEDAKLSMYDISLQNSAQAALDATKIRDPNKIRDGEEEEWKDLFMERDVHKQNALNESTYYEKVLKAGEEITLGKSKTTLDSLASIQRPKTIIGAMWNKFTDKETSVDVFNLKMSKLKQVVASNEINSLTFDRRAKSAEKIIADGGDPDLANALMGGPLSNEEKIKLERSKELGETREQTAKALVSNSAGLFSRIVTKITEQNKDVRVEVDDKKIVDAKDIITPANVATSIASLDELYAMVKKRFTPAGQKLFDIEADRIMKGEKLTIDIVTKLWQKSVNTSSWADEKGNKVFKIEMAQEELDSEVAASLADGLTEARANLESTIAANIKNPSKEASQKLANSANMFTMMQKALVTGISETRTGVVDLSKLGTFVPIAGTPYKNPNTGDILYADGKGEWLANDPTKLKQ